MGKMERVATTAERIAEAMKDAGKKQIDLAKEAGLSHSTISRYLSGAVEPRQDATHKLSVLLNVSELWLWGYDVPRERTLSQKKNDVLADIVIEMRSDDELFSMVEMLSRLSPEKRQAVKPVLLAFLTTEK
ncbi:MAG: helix-turn-helix domain-containing protein [Clostridia bacterium]|nr:helix-turn-helix domain-containing protein [Clostridia bacterium]